MPADTLNICQVSLARDIPIIIENYKRFKKIYKKIRIFIICPKSQIKQFKTHLKIKDIKIINEEKIISIKKFKNLFEKLSSKTKYKKKIEKRINWYYQQILKISFIIQFIKINKENIIIWDADTIILKKFDFFKSNKSILYGTFFEFHKPYYLTNKKILKKQPDYFISFLNQFIAITVKEGIFLSKILLKKKNYPVSKISYFVSKTILESIFKQHKIYNGSLFSEYELIGQSNYLMENKKQRPILSLRNGLDGKLNESQKSICIFLNFKHVTYEHAHNNKNSNGMLNRKQSWLRLIKILVKSTIKFYLRKLRHEFRYINR